SPPQVRREARRSHRGRARAGTGRRNRSATAVDCGEQRAEPPSRTWIRSVDSERVDASAWVLGFDNGQLPGGGRIQQMFGLGQRYACRAIFPAIGTPFMEYRTGNLAA